jgi:hypothetical protein
VKNIRWILIISALGIAAGCAVPFAAVLQDVNWEAVRALNFDAILKQGDLLAIPVMLVVMGIAAVTMIPFLRIFFPPAIQNGVEAEAEILKVRDTGTTINDNPQIGLLLKVKPSLSAPFEAEAKTIVSRLNAALVQPGGAARVVYDPKNPKRIQVQKLDIRHTPSANAVARMEELEQLRSRNLISDEEYQAKRREILDRI